MFASNILSKDLHTIGVLEKWGRKNDETPDLRLMAFYGYKIAKSDVQEPVSIGH